MCTSSLWLFSWSYNRFALASFAYIFLISAFFFLLFSSFFSFYLSLHFFFGFPWFLFSYFVLLFFLFYAFFCYFATVYLLFTFNVRNRRFFKKKGLRHLGAIEQKTVGVQNSALLPLYNLNWGKSRLKTCGFLHFYWVFCSISVSSLTVPLYGFRSSAEDFRSKSLCPSSESLRISRNLGISLIFSLLLSLWLNS